MGFVADLFNPNKGSGWKAGKADVINPFTTSYLQPAQQNVSGGMDLQRSLYNQMAGQNGIGNQSSVFSQQQQLADMLGAQARGEGPNPALAQLAQTTGQNVANQNALMAGQRGANANVGLLARQAAMQGSNTQQQAVGQAAILRANQQLAAQQALQAQQAQMANLAGTQVSQQANTLSNYNQFAQGNQSAWLNALGNYNNANVNMQGNANNANAGIQGKTAEGQQGLLGGIENAASAAAGFAGMARGGMVQNYATGGDVEMSMPPPPPPSFQFNQPLAFPGASMPMAPSSAPSLEMNQPLSFAANYLKSNPAPSVAVVKTQPEEKSVEPDGSNSKMNNNQASGANAIYQGTSNLGKTLIHSFQKPPLEANRGAIVPGAAPMKGDSLKNDTVPAMLSPKEIVIPRSITMGKDAPQKAKEFVAAVLAKNGLRGKK